jgi:hypothetical protein
MKQVTAVEWFNQQLVDRQNGDGDSRSWDEILDQAKEMEKQQHQETFKESRKAKIFEKYMPPVWESWEQYYSETFNK